MITLKRDDGLDTLLDLNGYVFVIDDELGLWVKFVAQKVPVTKEKPHGLNYSITLHNADGQRVIGFDNAHSIGKKIEFDHIHKSKSVKPYEYKNAASLIEDFWYEVEKYIKCLK